MPRGNIGITQIPYSLILWWSWPLIVQKCKECKGWQRENNKIRQREKRRDFRSWARYLLSFSKGCVCSRRSVDAIIVTAVITMTKGNEKKGVQGYVSGFLLFLKATSETAATAVTALCFSHCHKKSFLGWSEFMFRYYPWSPNSPPITVCNHCIRYNQCTRYNGKPLYRVQ